MTESGDNIEGENRLSRHPNVESTESETELWAEQGFLRPLGKRYIFPKCPFTSSQVKELPTLKDMDFLNKNQKVYIGEEEKKVFLEKLKRDVEVMMGVLWEMALFSFLLPSG